MAAVKQEFALFQREDLKKIHPRAWYKERLDTKFIKSLKPSDTSKILVGRNWTFLKDGLDDFRDGLPPVTDNILLKGTKGPGPNIQGSSQNASSVKQQAMKNRFSKHQICYSRCTPLQQQRREHIDEIEYGLTQHPLALYPHLEESVQPELFEDIVDILDPEMNMISDDEVIEEDEEEDDDEQETNDDDHSIAESSAPSTPSEEKTVKNPYRWLPRKDEKDKKDRKKASEKRSNSPQERHIENVTKEFCDWVADLGGESNNIEESTITSLFASGYETKPALSVPIHVVELTNVPPELRMSATVPQQPQNNQNLPEEEKKKKDWVYSGTYKPSWAKFKYGAWYLPTKSWLKRDCDEPLMDPKQLKDQETSEAKEKSTELNFELAAMHGSKAFMKFMEDKKTRKPEFLDQVADIQKKAAEEEERKREAEFNAKQKRQSFAKRTSAASK